MKCYPTIYKSIRFRSRLEAKWARFFDNFGWHWEYEPFDLEGWIPDFMLLGKHQTLVEVKPISEFDASVALEISTAAKPVANELMLVGMTIPVEPLDPHGLEPRPIIGWLAERFDDGSLPWWQDCVIGRWDGQKRLGYCASSGGFHDRISGQHDGGRYGRGEFQDDEALSAWRLAGRHTQWKGGPNG